MSQDWARLASPRARVNVTVEERKFNINFHFNFLHLLN